MSRSERLATWILIAMLAGSLSAAAQTGGRRPALIRDTEIAEGKDEEARPAEKPFNPLEAEKSLKVGDFYFKNKNYAAAIQRYMEALEYQPNRFDAYEALARAYEKQGSKEKAIRVYRDFLEKYPNSSRAEAFRKKLAKLEKK